MSQLQSMLMQDASLPSFCAAYADRLTDFEFEKASKLTSDLSAVQLIDMEADIFPKQ